MASSGSPSSVRAVRNQGRVVFRGLCGLLLAVAFLAAVPSRAQVAGAAAAPRVTPVREADRRCETCHAAIFRQYVTSPMANGSGAAEEHFVPGAVHHARSGMDYEVELEHAAGPAHGTPTLRYSRRGSPAVAGTHTLAYFLGSGNLGSTYLYREGGYLLESPVAFYAKERSYDMAPGLAGVTAMPPALPMTRGCMRCHMSDVQAPTPGSRDHFAGLPFLHGGITCEACHGDAGAHVASGGKAAVVNPMKLDAAARDSVCISCHLEGDVSVERKGRSIYEYRPGAHIADVLTHFVVARDSTSRSVSETEELEASRCKRASGDRMSCMSCHDAHGGPGPEQRVAFYRAKCLACHADATFARAHFPETPDCTGCHMPKGGAADTPHVAWTDHRLRQRPEQTAAGGPAMQGLELQTLQLKTLGAAAGSASPLPVFAGTPVPGRDLGLAAYKLAERGHAEMAPDAWRLLNEAYAADRQDAPVLMALAAMNAGRGQTEAARALFAEAVRLEPENVEAANDLATLLARAGDMAEARLLWEKTFALNEDVEALGVNLAVVQCAAGERERAIGTLARVLTLSPDLQVARSRLAALRSGQQECPAVAAR